MNLADFHEDFADEELFPIKELVFTDPFKAGAFGPITLCLKDGTKRRIDFGGIEGRLTL